MIAIDSSAILGILLKEEDASQLAYSIEKSDQILMSATTFVELHAVVKHKFGEPGKILLTRFFEYAGITIIPLTEEQAIIAAQAYTTYSSILNVGDCFSYALAKFYDIPLLFKGNDFSRTDLTIL